MKKQIIESFIKDKFQAIFLSKFSFLGAIPLSFYDSYHFFGPGQGSAVDVTKCDTLNTAAAVMCLNKTGDITIACI